VLKRPRTVVLKTFSKIFGLAGMRIGYAIGDPEIVQILQCIRDPFNVNSIGQAAAIAALGDDAHRQQGLESNARELPRVRAALAEFGIETTQSAANFVLMHLREDMPSVNEVVQGLLQCGVIVRPLQPYNLPRSIRVTIGKPDENKRFLAALSKVLARLMNVMVKAKLLD
jgi:histidinol-phosphate aminotransferase